MGALVMLGVDILVNKRQTALRNNKVWMANEANKCWPRDIKWNDESRWRMVKERRTKTRGKRERERERGEEKRWNMTDMT